MSTMRISRGSAGSFLCPPGHPMLRFHIEEGSSKNPRLMASLDYALKDEFGDVPESIKRRVQGLYDAATIVRSDVWERHLYGYFRNSYSPDGVERRVQRLLIVGMSEPLYPGHPLVESGRYQVSEYSSLNKGPVVLANDPRCTPDHHAAYLTVRAYFPDAEPRPELLDARNTLYGTRPCVKCDKRLQYEPNVDAFAEAITAILDCPAGGQHDAEIPPVVV